MSGVFKIKLKLGATVVAAAEGARKGNNEQQGGKGADAGHKGKGSRRKEGSSPSASGHKASGKAKGGEASAGGGAHQSSKKRKRHHADGGGKGKAPKPASNNRTASSPDLHTASPEPIDYPQPQPTSSLPSGSTKLSVPIRMPGKGKAAKKSKTPTQQGASRAEEDTAGGGLATEVWQDSYQTHSQPDAWNSAEPSVVATEPPSDAPVHGFRTFPSAASVAHVAAEQNVSTPTSEGKSTQLENPPAAFEPDSGYAKAEGFGVSSAGRGGVGLQQQSATAPLRKDLLRIVEKIQKKDEYEIFGEPVTEEMAPGYFDVVAQPMDFTAIRRKIDNNEYGSWEELSADLCLMFENAMLYNGPDTIYHQVALAMKTLALKMVQLGKEGVQSFRGRTAAIMRAHNAAQRNAVNVALEADQPESTEEAGNGRDGGQGTAIDLGGNRKGGGRPVGGASGFRELPPIRPNGEDYRGTYTFLADEPQPTSVSALPGIADGATSEGVAFRGGHFIVQHVQLPTPEAYLRSMCRFFPGLKGRARTQASRLCPL